MDVDVCFGPPNSASVDEDLAGVFELQADGHVELLVGWLVRNPARVFAVLVLQRPRLVKHLLRGRVALGPAAVVAWLVGAHGVDRRWV